MTTEYDTQHGWHVKADGQSYTCVQRASPYRHVFQVKGAEACKAALRLMGVTTEIQDIMWTAEYKRGYNVYR